MMEAKNSSPLEKAASQLRLVCAQISGSAPDLLSNCEKGVYQDSKTGQSSSLID
jgi:hypothetical protein